MTKKLTWMLLLLGLVIVAGMMSAEEKNRFGVEWDAAAVEGMSKTERMAYQKQYKAAMEEAARKAGVVPSQAPARKSSGRTAPKSTLVPGTAISYHSGTLSPAPGSSVSVGNRFNTALTGMGGLGPAEMSGSITMMTIDMDRVGASAAFISVYDQLAGTTANQVTSMSTPMVTGLNTITLPTAINYVGSSFLAGVWNFSSADDLINVATGTVGGQGFHGMSINDANPGTAFNAFASTNGAFAVQGDVATPVELMSFSID
jgi:hypothetical protein